MGDVIYEIDRPDSDLVSKLRQFSSAIIYEALGKKGALDSSLKPIDDSMKLCGPALTVHCHVGDNLTLHKALDIVEKGDVLVIDAESHTEGGYWGEIMTIAALEKEIEGLVIDGGIRDAEAITELGFPVFSRGICMKATVKKTLGSINKAINCAGTFVMPGDLIHGDRDGLVVIPREKIKKAYKKSIERKDFEEEVINRIQDGQSTLDLLNIR